MTNSLSPSSVETLGATLRGFRSTFLWTGLLSGLSNLLLLAPTLYMLQVFDRVMISGNVDTLVALTLITTVLIATMALSERLRAWILVRSGVRIDAILGQRVFTAGILQHLARRSHDPAQSLTDLTQLRQFLTGSGVIALFDLPWALLFLWALWSMHPLLGEISVAFMAMLVVVAWLGHRWTSPKQAAAGRELVVSNKFLHGKLRHAETVQALDMGTGLRKRWLELYERHLGLQRQALDRSHRMQTIGKYVQLALQSFILAIGAVLAARGELTIGAIVASNVLMSNALRPLMQLMGTWAQFVESRASYQRLSALIDPVITASVPGSGQVPQAPKSAHHVPNVFRSLEVRGLVATAPDGQTTILHDLDLALKPGSVTALIGPSGAGKSTLAQCLLGIWPHAQGDIRINGLPLDAWPRAELGPRLGYLPQDVQLFDATVAENISRLGELDSQAVIDAANRAGAHETILGLAKGYDTPVGEAGSYLSGGQRQRIGLARAIYGRPALVVLDEPSSRLDEAGEAALVRALQRLRADGCIVLLVTHSRALLKVCDQVLHLQAGRLATASPIEPSQQPHV